MIVFEGKPEDLAKCKESYTGKYLVAKTEYKHSKDVSANVPAIYIKSDMFYFFILNPNIIATQPLAGVSPGFIK